MSISFDKAFSVLPEALSLRGERMDVLASNIANVDTPNYKARDFDFNEVLAKATNQMSGDELKMETTNPFHSLDTFAPEGGIDLMYRNPTSPSLDGNTVEMHQEKVAFSENSVQYQIALAFLNGRISSLKSAIKGEG